MFGLLFLFSLIPNFVLSSEPDGSDGTDDEGFSSWEDFDEGNEPCPGDKCSEEGDDL